MTKTGESKANQFSLVAKSTLESLLSGEQFFRFGDYLSKGSCLVIEVSLNLSFPLIASSTIMCRRLVSIKGSERRLHNIPYSFY